MKYLVMVRGAQIDQDAMEGKGTPGHPVWSSEQVQAMFAHMGGINNDLAESGELVDAQGLGAPALARKVSRGPDGKFVVTDGPYSETKEVLAGYWVVDCPSIDRVTEIAERVLQCPVPEGSADYPVIIRPFGEGPGGDV